MKELKFLRIVPLKNGDELIITINEKLTENSISIDDIVNVETISQLPLEIVIWYKK